VGAIAPGRGSDGVVLRLRVGAGEAAGVVVPGR
jgi:hypothetical protein